MNNTFEFLMIVADPKIADFVATAGVNKLFVDLEILGKKARQGHKDTVLSVQNMSTVSTIRSAAPTAHMMVRVNPFNEKTKAEVDEVISRGADSIMLPYFHDAETLIRFFHIVNDRVEIIPLFETIGALRDLPQIVKEIDLKTIHIGLNDLHLERNDPLIFSPLALDVLEEPCDILKANEISFGIGGIARASEGVIPPEILLGEHVRLGSRAAILSRTFHRQSITIEDLKENMDFSEEIQRLKSIYNGFCKAQPELLENNRQVFKAKVFAASTI